MKRCLFFLFLFLINMLIEISAQTLNEVALGNNVTKSSQLKYENNNKQLNRVINKYNKLLYSNFEFGAGHMFNTYFLFRLNYVRIGIGGSITIEKESFYGVDFYEYFYNFVGLIDYRLLSRNHIWINIRGRIGKEYIKIDTITETGTILSKDLLIGYKKFYGVMAAQLFIGRIGTPFLFRVGLGYQLPLL